MRTRSGRLLIDCPDRPGLVATVAAFLAGEGGNITDADQHGERGHFFMRLAFDLVDGSNAETFASRVRDLAERDGLTIRLGWDDHRPSIAILASRQDHCLRDLLFRHDIGELPGDVAMVVSNHPGPGEAAERRGLRFVHLPVTPETKAEQEQALAEVVGDADLIVLARYMQILSPELCARWAGRCINIHHGLLPAFKGGRPYHQAWERGVKLIGATSHYVTAELDAGPILAQAIEPVGHRDSPDDLVRKGRDLERQVLATAVRAHLEDRVIVTGQRTVVFE
ncbi:MAG: formyltetrahydrofolate deformylase [Planctomycetota bacterium]